EPAEYLEGENSDTTAGGFLAAWDAVEFNRLARYHARIKPVIFSVLVHDPGHHRMIGPHVGGGDIGVRADEYVYLIDKLSRETLPLSQAEFLGIDSDAPFRPAVGDIHHGRLPRHERSDTANVVEIDFGVIANAPLHRP